MNNAEYSFTKPAMGTHLHVSFIEDIGKIEYCESLFAEICTYVDMEEKQYSRFISESQVSILNTHKKISASPQFMNIMTELQDIYTHTEKTFNPLLSPVFLGYTDDFNTQNHSFTEQSFPVSYNSNFEDIKIHKATQEILLEKGQVIDFGGFLKGRVAQTIAKKYATRTKGIIVNLGGDIAVQGKDIQSDTFSISITNPIHAERPITIALHNTSLSTSGTYKRKWKSSHHIVDAHSYASAQSDLCSASVIHTNGTLCDALSTCALVWGKEKSIEFFTKHSYSAILIDTQGTVHSLLTHTL